ncbi:MAG: NlpC/P60 family protein [Eubacteriales bacterium]|nr:NlpC/P60 family protein [Eubacteriales bacterium]
MKFTRTLITLALGLVLSAGILPLSAAAAQETMYGIGFVTGDSLRLRAQADTNAQILANAPRNDCVAVIAKEGQWYKVSYNLTVGYMHQDYLDVLTKENAELGYGKITGTNVNLRSGPSTAHAVVETADSGEKCYIIGLNEGWYKVLFQGKTCYVRSDFVELTEIPYENQASPNTPQYFRRGKPIGALPGASGSASSGSVTGADILAEAEKHLGAPYVNGGTTPSGFDCSGFVYYVLCQMGISTSRMIGDMAAQGTAVDKSQLEPGDVVIFSNTYGRGLSHVGIYAGDGQFIHAPNSRSTVSYSDLTTGYWSDHYHSARRMS